MEDGLFNGGKDQSDVRGISGLGKTRNGQSLLICVDGLMPVWYSLWIEIEVRTVHLVESPQEIFRRPVDIVAARVIGKVVAQR